LFHLNQSRNSFSTFFWNTSKLWNTKINSKNKILINPASWAGCGPRPNCAARSALRRPAKPAHYETESGPTRPSPFGCFSPPGENRGENPPAPDAGGLPVKSGRPAIIGRRVNSLGVASGDGGFELRRKAAGGSPWRLLDGGGRSGGGVRR
jgi:hypothetical protein